MSDTRSIEGELRQAAEQVFIHAVSGLRRLADELRDARGCPACGKPFGLDRFAIEHSDVHFCSEACRGDSCLEEGL